MKFDDLRLIQQIGILVDLAEDKTGAAYSYRFGSTYDGDESLTQYGLKRGVRELKTLTNQQIKLPDIAGEENRHFDLPGMSLDFRGSGNATSATDEITMRCTNSGDKNINPELKMDRFGITSKIILKGDILESLASCTVLINGIEDMLGEDSRISSALTALLSTVDDARALPKEVIDKLYINPQTSLRLHYIFNSFESTNRNYGSPFADVKATQKTEEKQLSSNKYQTVREFNARTATRALANGGPVEDDYVLTVTFGSDHTDEISVGYNIPGHTSIILEKFVPQDAHQDTIQFITDIGNYIQNVVDSSNASEKLSPLATHLVKEMNIRAPFIARDEKERVDTSYPF